jgi:hypothetical protein
MNEPRKAAVDVLGSARASRALFGRESYRLIRSLSDLGEKFRYICRNPRDSNIVDQVQDYRWLWTQQMSSAGAPKTAREARALPEQ